MAYSNITNVANMDGVLGNIATFLTSAGWTIVNNLGTPSQDGLPFNVTTNPVVQAAGRILIASKGDCLVCLRSSTAGLGADRLYLLGAYAGGTGSDGTITTNDGINVTDGTYKGTTNPGQCPLTQNLGANVRGFQQNVGPFPNLYLFSDAGGNYCHIVLEVFAGVYRHMHFGNLNKFGTWTGGAYFSGMFWSQSSSNPFPISDPASGSHTVPFDNQASQNLMGWTVHYERAPDKWIRGGTENTFGGIVCHEGRASVRGGFPTMFRNIPESLFSALIPLGPVIIGAVKQTDTPITTRWIGQVPDFRTINITNLLPAQEFSIGADTWKVFPMCAKNTVQTQNGSKTAGFAYKKIP